MKRFVIAILSIMLLAPPVFARETVQEGAKNVGHGFKEMGQAVGHAAKRDGTAVGHAFRDAGVATGKAFRELGHEIRNVFTRK